MKALHLSDQEIQRYVFNASNCEHEIIAHVQACNYCRNRAKSYQLIEAAIQSEQAPVFDFDLSALVVNQLPEKEDSMIDVLVYLSITLCLGGLSIILYFFGTDLLTVFRGVSTVSIYFIIGVVGLVFTLLSWDTYRSFQSRIRMIELL